MSNGSPEKQKVHSDLEILLKLQTIDYDLGELERSKEYLPDMMNTLSKEIDDVQKGLLEHKNSLEKARTTQGSLDLEIKTKEAELQKYQQQMMAIKTNKEYDALVSEIDVIKRTISVAETSLLETMEQLTTLEAGMEGLEEKMTHVKDNNARQLKILQEKIDSIGDKVSAKENIRKEAIAKVSRSTLSTYERVRRGKGGSVVVVVRKRACGSCHKSITAKKIQEIKRRDRLNTCDSCGCLLYWEDDESN